MKVFRFLELEFICLSLFMFTQVITTVPNSEADTLKSYAEVLSIAFLVITMVLSVALPEKQKKRKV